MPLAVCVTGGAIEDAGIDALMNPQDVDGFYRAAKPITQAAPCDVQCVILPLNCGDLESVCMGWGGVMTLRRL
jgi:hypothetical protein